MTSTYNQRIQQLNKETQPHKHGCNYYQKLLNEIRQDELAARGIHATSHTDFNGATSITLTLPPDMADTLQIISDMLSRAAHEARCSQKRVKSFASHEVKRIERMALNVFKKSKSMRLAAKASGMRPIEIKRLLVQINNYYGKKRLNARNRRIHELVKIQKKSLRVVGSIFKLNHNTIKSIADKFLA